jgi:RHS repeat-associated protein
VRTVVQAYVGGQWVAFSTTERDFLGRLPLGIETSFADGSAKSWRFMRGPDASGTLEGAGGARGVLAVLKDASSWKAVAADTLGNVLALAGTNGDFQRRTFDPWGNPLTRDAAGNLRASTLQERRADYDALPLAWASQEVDPDTGLTHYHFREYSPSLGGWLTRDPIGLAGGYLNLRSYLGNRPMDALDKDGRLAWVIPGAVIGGVIGGVFGGVVGAVDEYIDNPDASAWDLFKAGGKGLLVGGGAGAVLGSGVGLVAEVAAAGVGAAQAGLGATGTLTMAAHKANEVGIPQLIEAVGNPVPTAPVGAMVRTELGMLKAAGAGGKGAGQLGAKIYVAENAAARTAAQAEVTTSVRGKLPCPDVTKRAGILTKIGEDAWQSSGGLRYVGLDKNGLNRIEHVLQHVDPAVPGKSVFNVPRNQILGLLDEAYVSSARVSVPGDSAAFVTPMGRIVGTGGENALRLILKPGTSEVISAYPVKFP